MYPYDTEVTGPIPGPRPGEIGSAYIGIHADGREFPGEAERAVKAAGKAVEDDADDVGTDVGDRIGKGIEKEVGKHGPAIGKSIGDAVDKEVIDVKPNLRYNIRGKDGRFIRRAAQDIQQEVEQAFSRASRDGGIFSKFGQAISDAVGASFNISGRSPLIVGLIPVIGAIIGLVGALLQAINAVAAALTVIPGLIGAIGLQVGILMLAFQGVGTAVQGAFAATNAKELREALKDLTPSAQAFVKSLLPLKPLFEFLQRTAQQNFFLGLGKSVTAVLDNVIPPLKASFADLSFATGQAISNILSAFASPQFRAFLDELIPVTLRWIKQFGPAFGQFLIGLINLATAAMPFLSLLGDLLTKGLDKLGQNLTEIANDPAFQEWLASMYDTFLALGGLLKSVFNFLVVFLAQLDAAGGKALITSLTDVINMISAFLATEAGMRALNELIGIAIASFYILASVLIAVLFLAASVQAFIDWFIFTALPAVVDFFVWLGLSIETLIGHIGDFFVWLGKLIAEFFIGLAVRAREAWNDIADRLNAAGATIATFFGSIPERIRNAVGDLRETLFNAGRNVINGLLDGVRNALPNLRGLLNSITNMLPSWKGPETKDKKILEPAGRAVMEGFGEGIMAGAMDVKDMLGDFTTGLGGIGVNNTSNHILFGANSLQLNFRGALPTQDEAMATGVAVGAGINSQLAARNTRLAVRTL